MGLSGRLEGIAPSDIFQIISQSRMTGTLIARCPDGTAMIVFKDGQVIEAASDAPQESLGHLLTAQGLASEATIEAARERWKLEPERPFGSILVEMGAIGQQALDTEVRRQIGLIVQRLMSCDDGFITFDRGETAVKRKLNTGEFFLPGGVSPEFLIMERARVMDEERRTGTDRRRPASSGAAGPVGEARRATDDQPRPAAAPPARLAARIRGIKVPQALGTAVGRVRDLARSAAGLVNQHVLPRLAAAGNAVRTFSPDGKAMIFAGIGTLAAGIGLILLLSLSGRTATNDLVVTGRIVNLRSGPTTGSKVVTKVPQGETVAELEEKEGWHHVRTKDGETGWVWKNLVERQESTGAAAGYRVTGLELLLLAGGALITIGVLRKRRIRAAAAPGVGR